MLAVGLIDVDNFKKLNDSLGHAAGDEALKALATHVRTQLRPADQVARYGGEEFDVLLPATGVAEACEVLTRLQRSLSMGLFMHEGATSSSPSPPASRSGVPASRWTRRTSVPTARSTRPSGPGRTAPAPRSAAGPVVGTMRG